MANETKSTVTPKAVAEPIGKSGLEMRGGRVAEEYNRYLQGRAGVQAYREMSDDSDIDAVFGLMVDVLCGAKYFAVPAQLTGDSTDEELTEAKRWADFIDECLDDMEHSFIHHLSEAMTTPIFGWSWFEVLNKQRIGTDQKDPLKRSKHDDGLIGWRDFSMRGQETLEKWIVDEKTQELQGLKQMRVEEPIPRSRSLHYVLHGTKGNPEGRSMLRARWRPWKRVLAYEDLEAIVSERGPGYPIGFVPSEVLDENNTAMAPLRTALLKAVGSIRVNEKMAILWPAKTNSNGEPSGYDLEFNPATSGGPGALREAIRDNEKKILRGLRAAFLSLGQNEHGSFALASSQTDVFALALGGLVRIFLDEINNIEIPRLLAYNGMVDMRYMPHIEHGDFEKQKLDELSSFFPAMLQSGAITIGGEDEDWIREKIGMPPKRSHGVEVEPEEKPTEETTGEEVAAPESAMQEQENA